MTKNLVLFLSILGFFSTSSLVCIENLPKKTGILSAYNSIKTIYRGNSYNFKKAGRDIARANGKKPYRASKEVDGEIGFKSALEVATFDFYSVNSKAKAKIEEALPPGMKRSLALIYVWKIEAAKDPKVIGLQSTKSINYINKKSGLNMTSDEIQAKYDRVVERNITKAVGRYFSGSKQNAIAGPLISYFRHSTQNNFNRAAVKMTAVIARENPDINQLHKCIKAIFGSRNLLVSKFFKLINKEFRRQIANDQRQIADDQRQIAEYSRSNRKTLLEIARLGQQF